jgi:hypothetical protein
MKETFVKPLAVAVFGATWFSGAAAQNDGRIAIPLTDPARPVKLEVTLFNGSINVQAYDGNEILISTSEDDDDEWEWEWDFEDDDEDEDDDEARSDRAGLRRIPNTAIGVTAEENENTVSVGVDWGGRGVDLAISVPRQTSVTARTVNGDEIRLEGLLGDHELNNQNGDVIGIDLSGSAVVTSHNGDIDMSFMQLTPGKTMSFVSFNGDIEVAFPPAIAADFRVNPGRGDVYTDFDVQLQPQSEIVEGASERGRKQIRLEREMRLVVGGGGPAIQFKTFNGDVVIRRR